MTKASNSPLQEAHEHKYHEYHEGEGRFSNLPQGNTKMSKTKELENAIASMHQTHKLFASALKKKSKQSKPKKRKRK